MSDFIMGISERLKTKKAKSKASIRIIYSRGWEKILTQKGVLVKLYLKNEDKIKMFLDKDYREFSTYRLSVNL
jgi:hypothetical protein